MLRCMTIYVCHEYITTYLCKMLNNIIRHWHFSFHTRCALARLVARTQLLESIKLWNFFTYYLSNLFVSAQCLLSLSFILLPLSVSVHLSLCLSLDLIHRLRRCFSFSFSRSAFVATFKTRPKTLLSLFMNAQNGILMLFKTRTIWYFLYFLRLEHDIFSELFPCRRRPKSTEFFVSHLNMGFYCRSEENKICVCVCVRRSHFTSQQMNFVCVSHEC